MPKTVKDGTCIINLDKYGDIGTNWNALYNSNTESIYFDSFKVEHVPKQIKILTVHKYIKTNTSRI